MAVVRPTGYLSHYGFSPDETEEYLEHYGVKGMKWGKRLKRKITDLSDQYITGRSAKARMVTANREASMHDQKASEASAGAELRGKAAMTRNEDSRLVHRVLQNTENGNSGSFSTSTDVVRYRNIGLTGRRQLKNLKDNYTAEAKTNQQAGVALRNRQRAEENAAHASRAKAASAKRQYEKSLAGKLSKVISKSKPEKESTIKLTDLYTGETTTVKSKKPDPNVVTLYRLASTQKKKRNTSRR